MNFSHKFRILIASAVASSTTLAFGQPMTPGAGSSVSNDTPSTSQEKVVQPKTLESEEAGAIAPKAAPSNAGQPAGNPNHGSSPVASTEPTVAVQKEENSTLGESSDSNKKTNNEDSSVSQDKSNVIVQQAELFLYGDGGKVDLAKAAKLYAEAAEMGNPKAMMRLSAMYRRGQGVEKNEIEAFNLVRKAAELGYAAAQASLGAFYHDGVGVDKDYTLYRDWTKKAAENGHIIAMVMEANALEEEKDNPDAKSKAQDYLKKVKELATPLEIYSIAYSYHHGLRLPQDDEKALKWAMEGAERDEVNAMYLLGELRWTQRNFQEAANWFEKAAEKGLVAAQLQTGRIYKEGEEGIRPNPAKAIKWLSMAAKSGEKEDALSLAVLLKTGPSSVQDTKKAQQWLELYLEEANPDELHEVSEKYWKGVGVRKNYDIAGAVALASLQKGDQRYLCEFAEKLATPNWTKSDFVTAYVLLNDCVLETPEDTDLQNKFASLEQRMSAYQLQRAQQMDSDEALETYLKNHKPTIE